jgi:hypothetical protein
MVDSFKSYEGRVRWYPNPWSMVLFAILFRILLIPTAVKFLGAPNDHFKCNEPSHIAAHLVHGDGFASPYTSLAIPTAQQPPLYPSFVAGVFVLFGVFSNLSLYALLIANAVAGGLTALFVYRIGTKYFSRSVGSIAGWGWALLATFADLGVGAYAFATLAVVLWLHYVPDLAPNVRNWFLLGALTGVMLLQNPMLVWLIPASAFWLYRKQTLVIAGSALLILAPWYVRNYLVMEHVYLGLRDNLGLELYLGNHAGMSGTYDYWHPDSPYSAEMPKLGEAQFFEIRQKRALAFIRAEPSGFLTRSCQRVAEFWLRPWPILYTLLLGLAVLGFRAFPRQLRVFTAIMFLFYPLVFYITQVSWPTNYRHPIEPLILLMVSVTVCRYRCSVVSQSQHRTG